MRTWAGLLAGLAWGLLLARAACAADLVTGGDCEAGLPTFNGVVSVSNATTAVDAATYYAGSHSIQVTSSNASNGGLIFGSASSVNFTVGHTYSLAADIKSDGAHSVTMTALTSSANFGLSGNAAASWYHNTFTFTVPSGVTFSYFRILGAPSAAGAVFNVDNVSVIDITASPSPAPSVSVQPNTGVPTGEVFSDGYGGLSIAWGSLALPSPATAYSLRLVQQSAALVDLASSDVPAVAAGSVVMPKASSSPALVQYRWVGPSGAPSSTPVLTVGIPGAANGNTWLAANTVASFLSSVDTYASWALALMFSITALVLWWFLMG